MGYPGRHNIYVSTIRRMVTQALQAQELRFRLEHEMDTDEALLNLFRDWASVHGYTPWPGEMTGGDYLTERFGSWERLVSLAGLKTPTHPNRQQSFERVKEETEHQKELYRRKKAEKKLLAQKRLAERSAKRKEHENR